MFRHRRSQVAEQREGVLLPPVDENWGLRAYDSTLYGSRGMRLGRTSVHGAVW